ncbi:nuclear transport factor 2 family protein [Streptomyces scabiei]|uniref:nuclear transport factor 2 family protein n=1 Tax=Streptomyces scabiei TaxID=1930 RepID=UPI00298F93DD|nr:nuclear transport factor 2 family protein [Streptomyces scabiei]MDW8805225.1 nuclear transport factor 2 family protein [Streptomyces scabiei]
MPGYFDELDQLREQVRKLTDHAELRELFDRYVTALDREGGSEDDGSFSELFTGDAEFVYPIGTASGIPGFAAFRSEARGRWARTHHLSADHHITVDGDAAALRVRQIAAHVHPAPGPLTPFVVGGDYEAGAVRTDAGWRLSRIAFHVVWTTGDRLPEPGGVSW